MLTRKKPYATAIIAMAVLYTGGYLIGCVTPRHIDELKAEVREVKAQTGETHEAISRMDSVIVEGAEADKKLRNDMSITIDDLQQQIAALLENYNDLLAKMEQLSRQQSVTHVLRDSPGSQPESARSETESGPDTLQRQSDIDCTNKYDESFILVRRGEYEEAIQRFREFLGRCPGHDSSDNAYYWIGECYYSQEKYVEAIDEFKYLIDNYKSSVNVSRALYKMARSKQELGKKDEATALFQKLVDEFPESLEASQAKERLKDLR